MKQADQVIEQSIQRLNPAQKEAYDQVMGPLIVMAPAGTGKTDVIALRAYHAVQQGINPKKMLLLTFTNRASRSMKQRLEEVLGDTAGQMTISTFHGLCGYILRQEAQNLSLPRDFIIMDEEDARMVLREILSEKSLKRGLYYSEERLITDFLRLAREYPYIHSKKPELKEYFLSLAKERGMMSGIGWLGDMAPVIYNTYVKRLRDFGLVDFTALVTGVLKLFENPAIRQRWQDAYEWVELDEIQDTNKVEYEIIRIFYESHGNIGIFGDLHQTIYEWRGSIPGEIISSFKLSNQGYKEVYFQENYRSTRTILHAAETFLSGEKGEEVYSPEEKIQVRGFKTLQEENAYIGKKIQELHKQGMAYSKMAVLSRTNRDASDAGLGLAAQGIPVFLMEKTRFFSRDEIKNAMAYLKLMLNPKDILSLKRIHRELVDSFIGTEVEKYHLELVDFLKIENYSLEDPYKPLLEAYHKNQLVVFDVETTGLDIKSDQVIQIAALKGGISGVESIFERYIRIPGTVGESQAIHGISDEKLQQDGVTPVEAYRDFMTFIQGAALLGHNIGYDMGITAENMAREDMSFPPEQTPIYDTLELSKRTFKGLRSYSLGSLFQELALGHEPTHNALDDVKATLLLLNKIVDALEKTAEQRIALFKKYEDRFYPIARNLSLLHELSLEKRPYDIMHQSLIKSGFLEYYESRPQELEKLRELYRIFREYDDETLTTRESISKLLEIASLGNDTDRILTMKDQVPVITVHQAKGLEFDVVFVYCATDEKFPSDMSKDDERAMGEERRLFYVAITRPRKLLYITYNLGGEKKLLPSRFIHQIQTIYLNFQ